MGFAPRGNQVAVGCGKSQQTCVWFLGEDEEVGVNADLGFFTGNKVAGGFDGHIERIGCGWFGGGESQMGNTQVDIDEVKDDGVGVGRGVCDVSHALEGGMYGSLGGGIDKGEEVSEDEA